ncbi:S8 family serine peptidase [Massilia sp. B-10]|nr:S8 family serine peptidase [Massilia sp. B-10]
MSLGGEGPCDSTTQAAINGARSRGVVVVVAVSNDNANAANANPANCSGVITVASVDRSGGHAWYSNFGSVVDVAAPGGDTAIAANGILSTLNAGTGRGWPTTTPTSKAPRWRRRTWPAWPR